MVCLVGTYEIPLLSSDIFPAVNVLLERFETTCPAIFPEAVLFESVSDTVF